MRYLSNLKTIRINTVHLNLILNLIYSFSKASAGLLALTLTLVSTGCGGSGNAKRNTRNLFTLEIRTSSACGVNLTKSFTSQKLLCENISYELSRVGCAQIEFQREFNDNNCHQFGNLNPGNGFYNPPAGGPYVYNPGDIGGELPQHPAIDYGAIDNDYEAMILALDQYYTIDNETNCFATVKRTGQVFNLCAIENLGEGYDDDGAYNSGPEKDDADNFVSDSERATPTAPRLDEVPASPVKDSDESPTLPRERPSDQTSGGSDQDSSSDLEFNLVSFNATSSRYEERTDRRLPVLSITGRVTQDSPINGLTHSNPSELFVVAIAGQETVCPQLRAQLSIVASTIVTVISIAKDVSEIQLNSCRKLILNLPASEGFDLTFNESLEFSNKANVPKLFRFQNK